ncbi:VOC family protein [Flavobacterium sp. MAH-1]|uniref:VOC family protein n=2 Tax=Flavobacterium agri TaxID=2743471 RepID=A0A7Y8XZH6_9FLAO|nr:VOC family protein [Flavobacterium agri]NYA69713.1 VOC family protein [Flavobacterium agri]
MLYTNELEATIDFYVNGLGFTCGEYNEDWGWAALHLGDCEIMLAKPNEHTSFHKPTFTGSFYIKTDSVEVLWERFKDKVNICYGLETFDWGMREFAVYDNNGYVIQFGQQV